MRPLLSIFLSVTCTHFALDVPHYTILVLFQNMKIIVKPPKETFNEADWVSHVKIDNQVVGDHETEGFNNIKYTVIHLEVFKKPSSFDSLPSLVYGSSVGNLMLEEGKEYLLCGGSEDGKIFCVGGQVKPEEVFRTVAEWNQIPASFIELMKTFES
ncbi:hypothetical protein PFISCL1PPCAC_27983 [Pristionchus fissidentatus]|uniref:NTR domain-containing protein n=1 Tax=Pristionchus fissidentatus TaxID=1538716 RepID=A0AAV5WX78_9BILA|nr:hypothetical protein PFISCL1PPCAC_27983 [Pristionchus fissidentatus]